MSLSSSLKSEAPDPRRLRVAYDKNTGRFVISGPPWHVGYCRAIPNRRWDAKRKVWTAPCIRANVEHLAKSMPPSAATFDSDALQAMQDCLARIKAAKLPAEGGFPRHIYKFKTKPRIKQDEALDRCYGRPAFALFMDMRTGKTKVAIDTFSCYFMEGTCGGLLVFMPLTVRREWARQWEVHSPVKCNVHLLNTDKQEAYRRWLTSPAEDGFKIMLVGIESLSAGRAFGLCEHFLLHVAHGGVIVDEAHSIKNHQAIRTQKACKLARMARWRLVMTGTPIAKGPMDLYGIFQFLDPDIIGLGDFYSFRNRYAIMGGFEDREIVGYQNLDELFEIIGPFVYQVRQKEAIDVPDMQYEVRTVKLTAEQRKVYKELSSERHYESAVGSLDVANVLGLVMRQQQITGGFIAHQVDNPKKIEYAYSAIPGENPKVNAVMDIAEEADGSIVVWCKFKPEIAAVCAALRAEYGADQVVELHGDVDEDARLTNRQLFNEGKARFMVANQTTGGVGVEMAAADFMLYFSNTHSFIDRTQSEARPMFDGRKRPVMSIDIIAEGTVDEDVTQSNVMKMNLSEYVRGRIKESGSEWVKRLATVGST